MEKLRGHFKCPSAATSHYVTFTHLDFILHLFIVSDATVRRRGKRCRFASHFLFLQFEGSRSFFSEVDVVFYIANSDKMQKSRLPDVDFCNVSTSLVYAYSESPLLSVASDGHACQASGSTCPDICKSSRLTKLYECGSGKTKKSPPFVDDLQLTLSVPKIADTLSLHSLRNRYWCTLFISFSFVASAHH